MPERNKIKKLLPTPEPEELTFKNTVFLAYTDVAAVGSRALLGIRMRTEYFNLNVPEVSDLKPVCLRDSKPEEPHDQQFSALQVLNCKYEQYNKDEFTVVVVNAAVPGLKCHYVAGKIIDLCVRSKVEKMIILTALNIELPQFKTEMFENTFNNARTVTTYPPIPGSAKICDSFLSTIIQMIQVEGLPCNILTVLSHKVAPGKANSEDETLQKITLFQDTLTQITRLRFDYNLSASLVEGLPCNILTVLSHKVAPGKANSEDETLQKITLFQDTLTQITRLRFDYNLSASLVFNECTDPSGDLSSMIYI